MTNKHLAALILVLASTVALGQSTVPGLMTGEMPASAEFHSEMNLKNVFIGSVIASSAFDDNIQNLASNRVPGGQYFLGITGALQITRRHVKWSLSYAPSVGLASHGALNQFNQGLNHAFGTALELAPTQRLSFHLRQEYMVTTDPFQHLGENAFEPQIGLLDRPNESLVLPQLRRTSLLSEATVNYRLSRYTTTGVGGTYDVQSYGDVVGTTAAAPQLVNSKNASGYIYLAHQWSRRRSTGVEYRYSRFEFPGLAQRTIVHSVLMFAEIRLTIHSRVVAFVGPQYSQLHDQSLPGFSNLPESLFLHQHTLSPAAGVVYTFSTGRNLFRAEYVRQVTDGGGLLPTVSMNGGGISFERRLTREWSCQLAGSVTRNSSFDSLQPFGYQSFGASGELKRNISNSILLGIRYERLNQTNTELYSAFNNRAYLSIGYTFTKPLGR